jgi:cell division protein ZapA (FtsZ GTPase activity inhibitor)
MAEKKDDLQLIRIFIQGRELRMNVRRDIEPVYRNAKNLLDEVFILYQKKFPKRSWEDILIYSAYNLAVELVMKNDEEDIAPLAEKINSLKDELDMILSEE